MIEPSRELRDACAIVGAGHSRLGRVPGVSSLDLLVEAMRNAIADAGINVSEIDGIVCRGPDDIYSHHQQIGARLGINVKFSTSLDNGGASQILAVAIASMAIKAGMATTVICGYGRDSWSRTHSSEEARVTNQTTPDEPAAEGVRARIRLFRRGRRARVSAPRATCISTARRAISSARSRSPAASMRCAIPTPR